MLHIIISRMRFPDRSLLNEYLKITKKYLIPSLKSQTNQNFFWGVMILPKDIDYVKKYLGYDFISFNDYEHYFNFVKKNDIKIQTRHDIDDFMCPDYVKKIQDIYRENYKKLDTFLLSFQPIKYDIRINRELPMTQYDKKNTSQFLTICQKDIQYSIHEKYFHGEMGQLTNNIFIIKDTYVKWIIHGNNLTCDNERK